MVTEIEKLTDEQLEELLSKRKEEKRLAKIAQKEAYEKDRNSMVAVLISEAVELHASMLQFKQQAMQQLSNWLERMKEYGEGKEDQQNCQLLSADGTLKIIYTKSISKGFDERSKLAEEKLKQYLEVKVKKRDKESYKLIMSLLERNHVTGELDISNINRMYKMEEEINDPLFSESMALFRESYVETTSKNYARFYKKGENNQWQAIVLDFAVL